jgi:glucan phosphorylase
MAMRFGSSRSQLYDAQKTSRAKWEAACELWNDSARQDFAEQTWEPLDRAVSEYLRAIDQLSSLFAGIRSECEIGS